MRNYLVLFFLFFVSFSSAQELNCEVVVNAQLTGNENLQLFKNLERQLKEFVNNKAWTNKVYKPQERIISSMVININEYNSDLFSATIQVQASRPVYGSSFTTPIYNFNDGDFTFKYLEFQNLIYNPGQFESNLVSVIAYHVYMILAIDAETFAENGGDQYFKQAQTIVNYSQQTNFKGWKPEDGLQTRYQLVENVLSTTYKEYRKVMYQYHRDGLDAMSENPKKGKEAISKALLQLDVMNRRRPNSFLLRTFFDTKADEITDIFSGGPKITITKLIATLNKVAPLHSSKWRNISF
jgi:hypothetical protein